MVTYVFQYECRFRGGWDPGSVKEDAVSVFKGSSDKKVRGLQVITEECVEFINELGMEFSSPKCHFFRRCDDDTTA
jgi:hypothetical protein